MGSLNATSTTEQATVQLRFVLRDGKRILQQLWVVMSYEYGKAKTRSDEWRDVPLEDEAKS